MFYVGIDWSSRFDDVCILDDAGVLVNEFRIGIDSAGFAKVLDVLAEMELRKDQVLIGIETDRNILADFLIAAGYSVYNLNPLCVNRFKQRYRTAPKKDDRFDARMIATMLLKDGDAFRPVQRSSAQCIELRTHCESIGFLVRQRTTLINRLRADLALYFPAFPAFFNHLDTSVPMEVLRVFPGPQALRGVSAEDFVIRTKHIAYLPDKRALKMFVALTQDVAFAHQSSLESGLSIRVQAIAEQILLINRQIRSLEQTVATIFSSHALASVFESLPGAGARLAPRLLSLFGDNFERFRSAGQLQCYAGTAPVTERSGIAFHAVKMRRACSKPFRDTLFQFAFCSLKVESWANDFYRGHRAKGHTHSKSIRALSNKWAKIIYAMWRDGAPYERENFLRRRAA